MLFTKGGDRKELVKLLDQEFKDARFLSSDSYSNTVDLQGMPFSGPRKQYQQHILDTSDAPYLPGHIPGPFHMLIHSSQQPSKVGTSLAPFYR